MHPGFGYYSTKQTIFNKGGDFTTSPEISQMFGEMVGVWLMTALKNYEEVSTTEAKKDVSAVSTKDLQTINLVEIGPGTGQMMCDILRTLKTFTGNLKHVHVNLIDSSPNLVKNQQEKLMKYLQEDLEIFLSYQMPKEDKETEKPKQTSRGPVVPNQREGPQIDKFINKDQDFSISWYPSLKDYYNEYLQVRLDVMSDLSGKPGKKGAKRPSKDKVQKDAENLMKNPCFILAHELYDALPVHQFHLNESRQWCEKVVQINPETGELEFAITDGPTENVDIKLQPSKFFSPEAQKDLKPGDSIEICPEAISLTKDLSNLIELSRGMGLIIDYGEAHSFSNSFRGLKNHKLVKEEDEIMSNIGNIDLTTYVDFRQIKQIAIQNK